MILFQSFFIFPWPHDLEKLTSLSVSLGVPLVSKNVRLLAIVCVKSSVEKKHKFRKINTMQHVLVALQ